MYGLKQAGIIAHKALIYHLAPFGYHPARHTPGLWQHETRDTIFTLVVDDFAIKYTSLDNAQHLLHALKEKYTISDDCLLFLVDGGNVVKLRLHTLTWRV